MRDLHSYLVICYIILAEQNGRLLLFIHAIGALAQLGERIAGSDEVRGSIPLGSTRKALL